MKRFLLLLIFVAGAAQADCFVRVNAKLTLNQLDVAPVDFQELKTPGQCVVRYRVNIRNEWKTVEGSGATCEQARDVQRGVLLEEVSPDRITSRTQMVCSDIPEIRVRPVRRGDRIWESEVDLHVEPKERPYFWYKRTQCRMFVERNIQGGNFYTHQGIICQENSQPNSKWIVVDKY